MKGFVETMTIELKLEGRVECEKEKRKVSNKDKIP